MATKTKDVVVNFNDFAEDNYAEFNAKGKNLIRIDGITTDFSKNLEFSINNSGLIIKYDDKSIIIKNYKDIKYLKTEYQKIGKKTTYNLYDLVSNNVINNETEINTYNSKKLTVTGTIYNDIINLSDTDYTPVGTKNIKANKGLTINGGNGNDTIYGTNYNDTINGGNGDDTIEAGKGNDTITGGKGFNTIVHHTGNGNDTINLTKGENLLLKVDSLAENDSNGTYSIKYSSNKKDILIYTSEDEFITIKNLGAKDVTNNSSKKNEDTSSVLLQVGNNIINLRKQSDDTSTGYINTKTDKNFTGTWLNDKIDASEAYLEKTIKLDGKKQTVEKDITDKGLILNGGKGDDIIIGSRYSDIIKAGSTGNVKIAGGTGNDKLYAGTSANSTTEFVFTKGDGIDVVYGGKGTDTLTFEGFTSTIVFVKDKRDLIVQYGRDYDGTLTDYVTVKDFYDKKGNIISSVKYLNIGGNQYSIKDYIDKVLTITSEEKFEGSSDDEIIIGATGNNTLKGNEGNDILLPSTTTTTILGGAGDDIIYSGSNVTSIYTDVGNDTVYLSDNGKVINVMLEKGNDTVYTAKTGSCNIYVTGSVNGWLGSKEGNDDVIYWNGANTNICFGKTQYQDITFLRETGSDDLLLRYGTNNSVTLKDYFKSGNEDMVNHLGILGVKTFGELGKDYVTKSFEEAITEKGGIKTFISGSGEINGTSQNEYILGSIGNDIITSNGGNDILNGGAGDDIYNVSSLENKTVIIDSDGENILNLTDVKKDDVNIIFNIKNNGSFSFGYDRFYIVDDTTMNNWMSDGGLPTSGIEVNDFKTVETINSSDGYYLTTSDINTVTQEVASWLAENGYADVNDVFANEQTAGDINALIAKFNSIEWQPQELQVQ